MRQPTWVQSEKSTNGRTETAQAEPDGEPPLLIRPIQPSDSTALQYAFEHEFSAQSRYLRFHSALRRLPDRLVHYLTHVDGVDHVALVAFEFGAGQPASGVGVGRFVRDPKRPNLAEVAVAVVDHAQGHGIGRSLIAALAVAARERGIDAFTMEVLFSNRRVRDWLLRLGANSVGSVSGGAISFQLPVAALLINSLNSERNSAA